MRLPLAREVEHVNSWAARLNVKWWLLLVKHERRRGQYAQALVNLQKGTRRMSPAGKGRAPKRRPQSWPRSVGILSIRQKADSPPIHKTDTRGGCRTRSDLK